MSYDSARAPTLSRILTRLTRAIGGDRQLRLNELTANRGTKRTVKLYRPGILASRATRVANAHIRSLPLQRAIEGMEGATIPEMVSRLRAEGFTAARGGEVTYNTVKRAMERSGQEIPAITRPAKHRTTKTHNVLARVERYEVFRTPPYSFTPLLDYSAHFGQLNIGYGY